MEAMNMKPSIRHAAAAATENQRTSDLLDYFLDIVRSGRDVKRQDVIYAIRLSQPDKGVDLKKLSKEKIIVSVKGAVITPKTKGQIAYVDAIKVYDELEEKIGITEEFSMKKHDYMTIIYSMYPPHRFLSTCQY